MKMYYISYRNKHRDRKQARFERSFDKRTNRSVNNRVLSKKKNKGQKGFDKFFYYMEGSTSTKKGLKNKYRGKFYR